MTSDEENEMVSNLVADKKVWLGGSWQGAHWSPQWGGSPQFGGVTPVGWAWSDNSTWGYTNWGGDSDDYCIKFKNKKWHTQDCDDWEEQFICQKLNTLERNATTRLSFKKDQLNFSNFNVWYKYKASGQQSLDSWKDKRMTGFRLSWKIANNNEDRRQQAPTPVYKAPLLDDMILLARDLRFQNVKKEDFLNEIIQQKSQMNITQEVDMMCSIGQIKREHQKQVITRLVINIQANKASKEASDKDIETGYEVFHAAVFCPTILFKLYTYIDHLLSNETLRTIIQTVVHLFKSGAIADATSFKLAKQFYNVMALTLDLQYGNVLLAASTIAELERVESNNWPFLTNYTDLANRCAQERNCDFVQDFHQILGMSSLIFFIS